MTRTSVSIAFDPESLERLARLMDGSLLASGAHCGEDDDD
jgi:hypothetical protein